MTLQVIDETHASNLTSWVESAIGHIDFPIQNLPLGVFSHDGDEPRGGIAIGDCVVDLAALSRSGLLDGVAQTAALAAANPSLNTLLEMGQEPRRALRRALSKLLSDEGFRSAVGKLLVPMDRVTMELPARIGDYTDFYVGIHHATNIGTLLRPDNPLLPNYKHVPIGYHGRASSVRKSGTPVHRPTGQRKPADQLGPLYGPTQRLDYELEIGVWIGSGNQLGCPIPIEEASQHIAGISLLNDWSARDFQAWEYQPLGPFLAKNFLTTVSPWIVTNEALAPFRISQPSRPAGDPEPLPYLWDQNDQANGALALTLEVYLQTAAMKAAGIDPFRLSRGPASNMYWTIAQMVTHHASNGCDLHAGDLLGSGTISAPTRDGFGSLMEISRNGTEAVRLPSGESRTFLEDGDEISLSAHLEMPGYVSIGFGECKGQIVAAGSEQ